MEWMVLIKKTIQHIEEHITEDISVDDLAEQIGISPFFLQKGFAMLCGYSISEYIRNRRLTLAGKELLGTNVKVIDLAIKYGYESPDSFTKAFTRFHGVSPIAARKDEVMLKNFVPLKLKLSVEGGFLIDYKIVNKNSFTVVGNLRKFTYSDCGENITAFWREHYSCDACSKIVGTFGVTIDDTENEEDFEYVIADLYNPCTDIPEGMITREIPASTWAVFPCYGPAEKTLPMAHAKMYSEWLLTLDGYDFIAGYSIEFYDNYEKYPKGAWDENYYCEIWIPITKHKE